MKALQTQRGTKYRKKKPWAGNYKSSFTFEVGKKNTPSMIIMQDIDSMVTLT